LPGLCVPLTAPCFSSRYEYASTTHTWHDLSLVTCPCIVPVHACTGFFVLLGLRIGPCTWGPFAMCLLRGFPSTGGVCMRPTHAFAYHSCGISPTVKWHVVRATQDLLDGPSCHRAKEFEAALEAMCRCHHITVVTLRSSNVMFINHVLQLSLRTVSTGPCETTAGRMLVLGLRGWHGVLCPCQLSARPSAAAGAPAFLGLGSEGIHLSPWGGRNMTRPYERILGTTTSAPASRATPDWGTAMWPSVPLRHSCCSVSTRCPCPEALRPVTRLLGQVASYRRPSKPAVANRG